MKDKNYLNFARSRWPQSKRELDDILEIFYSDIMFYMGGSIDPDSVEQVSFDDILEVLYSDILFYMGGTTDSDVEEQVSPSSVDDDNDGTSVDDDNDGTSVGDDNDGIYQDDLFEWGDIGPTAALLRYIGLATVFPILLMYATTILIADTYIAIVAFIKAFFANIYDALPGLLQTILCAILPDIEFPDPPTEGEDLLPPILLLVFIVLSIPWFILAIIPLILILLGFAVLIRLMIAFLIGL